jgi:TRAP-type C4-dicarboxylate transport system substrate-binding protein
MAVGHHAHRVWRLGPVLAFGLGLTLAVAPLVAQTTTLRVGTIVPLDSKWHQILLDMGQRWRVASKEKVKLTIFAGTLGDEAELISKMGLRQIQVAAVTSTGLEKITKDCAALSIPLLFESNEELDYVRERMEPKLEAALAAKGYVVLNWGDGGWVRFFSVRPAKTIAEFKKLKLFTWAGNPDSELLYKDAGFQPVPLAPSEILQNLQSGKIEAFPAPPIAALAFQWFGLAKNMIDMKFAPIIGATIITRSAWEQIDPNLRPILMKEARAAGDRLKREIRQIDDEAIAEMKKRNLVVYSPTPAERAEWKQTVEKFYPRIRGEIVQPADFDEVKRLVAEYRATRK